MPSPARLGCSPHTRSARMRHMCCALVRRQGWQRSAGSARASAYRSASAASLQRRRWTPSCKRCRGAGGRAAPWRLGRGLGRASHPLDPPPLQAGDQLVVVEVHSEVLCQTGFEEEAELQWKVDQQQVLAPCADLKHVFARTARDCPDVVFLSVEVSGRAALPRRHMAPLTTRGPAAPAAATLPAPADALPSARAPLSRRAGRQRGGRRDVRGAGG